MKATIACFALFAVALTAQERRPEAPVGIPLVRGVFYRTAQGWGDLPYNLLMPIKEGSGKQLFWYGNSDAVAEVQGPHAVVRTSAKPTFYLRGYPAAHGIYLVREIEKQDYREVKMPYSSDFRQWTSFRKSDLADITVTNVIDDVVSITPKADLKPGEYLVVSVLDPQTRHIRVAYDFGVN
jgi:hypothetical protein